MCIYTDIHNLIILHRETPPMSQDFHSVLIQNPHLNLEVATKGVNTVPYRRHTYNASTNSYEMFTFIPKKKNKWKRSQSVVWLPTQIIMWFQSCCGAESKRSVMGCGMAEAYWLLDSGGPVGLAVSSLSFDYGTLLWNGDLQHPK